MANKHIKLKTYHIITALVILLVITACGSGGGPSSDDGDIINTLNLPTDTRLDLHCPDIGIATETCILDDPANPFARVVLTHPTGTFQLHEQTMGIPKANFYLWGTTLAQGPIGEKQYYTALALHKLYSLSNSELIKQQAIKAYRSVLDNYFDSAMFVPGPPGIFFPIRLREEAARRLYSRSNPNDNTVALFDSQDQARATIGQWGYTYDPDRGDVTENE